LATGLLNHVGDVNLGIHEIPEFPRSVSKNFLNLRDGWNIARKHELWKDPINMTALVAIYDLKPRIAMFRL
jgi:hypothetical protein